jgi:Bacteriocin-protection, YdeI or OmpD-Associated/Domain of unknown function (DUF1905)
VSSVDFEATITQDGESFFIQVPPEAVAALGPLKRPPVQVTLNGYTYRTTVMVYGGKSYLGLRREIREAAAVSPGQRLMVTLALDEQPRTVDVPDDLARELERDPGAHSAFARLSYTNQKEYVAWIQSAKRPETRLRRIAQTVEKLSG